mgnify:FL=1
MKLVETIMASEWIDGSGWSYEDSIITVNEGNFPFNSQDEVKEFCEQGDWGDYGDYYSSELAEGIDIKLTVKFETPDGDFIAEMSEWVSELQKED